MGPVDSNIFAIPFFFALCPFVFAWFLALLLSIYTGLKRILENHNALFYFSLRGYLYNCGCVYIATGMYLGWVSEIKLTQVVIKLELLTVKSHSHYLILPVNSILINTVFSIPIFQVLRSCTITLMFY